jgi:hypothetical protein
VDSIKHFPRTQCCKVNQISGWKLICWSAEVLKISQASFPSGLQQNQDAAYAVMLAQ